MHNLVIAQPLDFQLVALSMEAIRNLVINNAMQIMTYRLWTKAMNDERIVVETERTSYSSIV